MLLPVMLNLSRRSTARDAWRAVSDLFGGTLAVAVWLSLWLWIVLDVVPSLSSAIDAPRVAAPLLM